MLSNTTGTVFLIPLILFAGCASSQENTTIPEEYANTVEITPATGQQSGPSVIYVDSAAVIQRDDRHSLLVMGYFPDGCTHIGNARHTVTDKTISLDLNAWRNPQQMCTQALVAFSFIYSDLPESRLQQASSVTINGTNFELGH
ncbi:MAG: hypothetical protein R3281_05835 [Balneolaceae bacterium]|nr:hypothetical protein [Balneolaceae bacterium]